MTERCIEFICRQNLLKFYTLYQQKCTHATYLRLFLLQSYQDTQILNYTKLNYIFYIITQHKCINEIKQWSLFYVIFRSLT